MDLASVRTSQTLKLTGQLEKGSVTALTTRGLENQSLRVPANTTAPFFETARATGTHGGGGFGHALVSAESRTLPTLEVLQGGRGGISNFHNRALITSSAVDVTSQTSRLTSGVASNVTTGVGSRLTSGTSVTTAVGSNVTTGVGSSATSLVENSTGRLLRQAETHVGENLVGENIVGRSARGSAERSVVESFATPEGTLYQHRFTGQTLTALEADAIRASEGLGTRAEIKAVSDGEIIAEKSIVETTEISPQFFENQLPYNPRSMETMLSETYGVENVISSTLLHQNERMVHMAGKTHPVTGIPYDVKGFSIFDEVAIFDVKLTGDVALSVASDTHKILATKELRKVINANTLLKSKFSEKQLEDILKGRARINGYTWHHHQDIGRMQLLPRSIHEKTGHVGEDIWTRGIYVEK